MSLKKWHLLSDVIWVAIIIVLFLLVLFAPDVPLEGASAGPAFWMRPQSREAKEFLADLEMGYVRCSDGGVMVNSKKYTPSFHFKSKTLTFYRVMGSCRPKL